MAVPIIPYRATDPHSVEHVRNQQREAINAAIAETLAAEAQPGDAVIALGAGDINKILPVIAEKLQARFGAGSSA